MPLISFQYKVKIGQRVQNENDQKFISSLNGYVAGQPAGIITARKIESWQVFKKGYPEEYKEMLEYISHRAKYDLNRADHVCCDISGRYPLQLDWHNIEVDVNYPDIQNLHSPEISVFLTSPEYLLLEQFGDKLLITDNLDSTEKSKQTMVVVLSETLTINKYSK